MLGRIALEPVGVYGYAKGLSAGRTLDVKVEVFPLEVTSELVVTDDEKLHNQVVLRAIDGLPDGVENETNRNALRRALGQRIDERMPDRVVAENEHRHINRLLCVLNEPHEAGIGILTRR